MSYIDNAIYKFLTLTLPSEHTISLKTLLLKELF